MHKALLSIGTNTDARLNLNRAMHNLRNHFPSIQFTRVIKSKPYGEEIYKHSFLNMLAYFKTNISRNEIVMLLKTIEENMGRKPEHKLNGKVIIDIDLIKWNDEIVKSEDFKRSYVRELLKLVND